MSQTTERRFLYSTVASYGSQLGRMALRLATDLALARLIIPEHHGLFALAWSTVVLAGFVRDLGLQYELVRHERQPYGSVLLWEILSGTLVTAGLIAFAGYFGGLDPELPGVLRVLAFFVLIEAFAIVPRVFFERELRVTRLVVPELLRGAVLAAISIALAVSGAGVWSFVVGELIAMLCFVVILWIRAWTSIHLEFDWRAIPQLLRKSMLLFLIALVSNAMPFVGRYIVEIRDSTAMVGQYEKALLWAMRAQILFVPALIRALYPALVAYRTDHKRFVAAYRLGTVAILSIEVMAVYFLFFNTEIVILEILLGPNWVDAVALIKIVCFATLIDPFTRLGGELLKVRRQDRVWLIVAIINFTCLVGFGWLLSGRYGTEGMAWAHYLLLGNILMAWRVWQICGPEFPRLLKDLAFVYLLPLPLFLGLAAIFPAAGWPRFVACVALLAVIGLIYLRRFADPFKRFFGGPPPAPTSSSGSAPDIPESSSS
ncbi:MAG: oligosaccharide flippase family protein [Thermoanaerobaculia bacterium]